MKLPRKTIGFILIFLLLVLLFGCQKSGQRTSENLFLAKTETQPTRLLTLPQIELVETPKYKELKIRVKFQRAKVEELENQRIKLLVIYTEIFPKVKIKTKQLLIRTREIEESGNTTG